MLETLFIHACFLILFNAFWVQVWSSIVISINVYSLSGQIMRTPTRNSSTELQNFSWHICGSLFQDFEFILFYSGCYLIIDYCLQIWYRIFPIRQVSALPENFQDSDPLVHFNNILNNFRNLSRQDLFEGKNWFFSNFITACFLYLSLMIVQIFGWAVIWHLWFLHF